MTESPRSRSPAARSTGAELLAAAQFDHRLGPFEVFGQRFALHTTDAGLAGLLGELYAPMCVQDVAAGSERPLVDYRLLPPRDDQPGVVGQGERVLVTSPRPARLLGRLVWAINRQVIEGAGDRLLLHAAAAEVEGVGVLLPADMEAGKTTLVTGLIDRGAAYLTDEAASVAPDLTLEGFSKPLSIDPGSWPLFDHHRPVLDEDLAAYLLTQWQVPAHTAGRVIARSRLGLIVFRRFERDTSTRIEALRPAAAVQQAVGCTFVTDTEHLPVAKLRALAALIQQVPAYEVVGDDLDAACDAVVRLVAEHAEA